jgi:hypothetical protein
MHAPVIATLHHGEQVELISRRRRFIKIRMAFGVEGWTDSRLLFSTQAKSNFEALQERAAHAPSLGETTSLDPVSAHTAPNRQAPALFQVAPKKPVQEIAHQRVERIPWDPPPLLDENASKAKLARKKKEPPKYPPPPPGPPPPVPDDWLLLSGYSQDHLPEEKPNVTPPAPPSLDDWTLVRAPDGRSGWVLDRALYLSIPDEVMQYAERARIVAYFNLGTIHDKQRDLTKTVWLWAAQSSAARDREFDSLRIFVWSLNHHRYETSWIEKGVQGAGPVELKKEGSTPVGFSVLVHEKDGRLMKRDYALQGFRARLASRTPAKLPEPWYVPTPHNGAVDAIPETVVRATAFWDRLVEKLNLRRSGSAR